jgi:hypothetical protein
MFSFFLDFRVCLREIRSCESKIAGQEGIAKPESHLGTVEFDGENMNCRGNVTLFSCREGQEGFQGGRIFAISGPSKSE